MFVLVSSAKVICLRWMGWPSQNSRSRTSYSNDRCRRWTSRSGPGLLPSQDKLMNLIEWLKLGLLKPAEDPTDVKKPISRIGFKRYLGQSFISRNCTPCWTKISLMSFPGSTINSFQWALKHPVGVLSEPASWNMATSSDLSTVPGAPNVYQKRQKMVKLPLSALEATVAGPCTGVDRNFSGGVHSWRDAAATGTGPGGADSQTASEQKEKQKYLDSKVDFWDGCS